MTSTAFSQLPPTGAAPLEPFEVHRRAWLYLLVVVLPLLLAGGYGWLAYDRRELLFVAPAVLLVLMAIAFGPALRDLRAPLLVADEHGVRLQGSQGWVGLLWSEIESIAVRAQGGLRSPRLRLVTDQNGGTYSVPLGLVTDCSAGHAEVELARRRAASRS